MDKTHGDLIHAVCMFRGHTVNLVVILERIIDSYLAHYFCETERKRNDLLRYFLSTERVSFHFKKDILLSVLKKNDKVFYKKHIMNLDKDLRNIISTRNTLSHQLIDYTDAGLKAYNDNILQLIKGSSEHVKIKFSESETIETQKKGFILHKSVRRIDGK